MVVHDLKNPVNGISMMVQLAMRKGDALPEAHRGYLRQIDVTCREMMRLIENLLEIADVLCVNKADREGALDLAEALKGALDRGAPRPWRPPLVTTSRGPGGAAPLHEALDAHAKWLLEGDRLAERRRKGLEQRLRTLVSALLAERLLAGQDALLLARADEAASKRRSLLDAARSTVEEILR